MTNRYEKYKPTDLEWIRKIPEHWEVKRLKHIGKHYTGSTPQSGNPIFWNGEIIWITPEDLSNRATPYIEDSKRKITELGLAEIGNELVDSKSIIVSTRAPIGNIGIAALPLTFNQGCKAIKAYDNIYSYKFLYYYLLCSKEYLQSFGRGTTFTELSAQSLKDLGIPICPLNEQTAIADYLDAKTAQIDSLIAKKKQLIELLKEEKTAIINKAVNGEGKNWKSKKLSHSFKKIGSGTTPSSDNQEYYNGTINWLQTGDLKDGEISEVSKKITQKALDDYSTLRQFPKGSLVIAMYGATIGKVGILNISTTTNQACCVLSEPVSFDVKFIFYWFIGNKEFIVSKAYGGGQPNISQELIKSLRIPCPNLEEQIKVAQSIENNIQRINNVVIKIESEIQLIQEYRTSLISEVVTGKQKVIDQPIVILIPSRQAALAAEIISQLYEEKTFGRVKFQKILYLCEYACHLEEFGSSYIRAAAGPLDEELLAELEKVLRQLQWVDTVSTPSNKYKERISYTPFPKLNAYSKWYNQYWGDKDEEIQHIIGLLRYADTEKCEMMATLFAAWNDLIIKGYETPDDNLIIQEVYNWHQSKKRITKDKWQKELAFMRKQKLIPKGFGQITLSNEK